MARRLAVDPSTVRRWIEAGQLEAVKAGRRWRVDPRVLNAWIEANTTTSTPLTLAPGGAR